jgi:hypothetical protein
MQTCGANATSQGPTHVDPLRVQSNLKISEPERDCPPCMTTPSRDAVRPRLTFVVPTSGSRASRSQIGYHVCGEARSKI